MTKHKLIQEDGLWVVRVGSTNSISHVDRQFLSIQFHQYSHWLGCCSWLTPQVKCKGLRLLCDSRLFFFSWWRLLHCGMSWHSIYWGHWLSLCLAEWQWGGFCQKSLCETSPDTSKGQVLDVLCCVCLCIVFRHNSRTKASSQVSSLLPSHQLLRSFQTQTLLQTCLLRQLHQ